MIKIVAKISVYNNSEFSSLSPIMQVELARKEIIKRIGKENKKNLIVLPTNGPTSFEILEYNPEPEKIISKKQILKG